MSALARNTKVSLTAFAIGVVVFFGPSYLPSIADRSLFTPEGTVLRRPGAYCETFDVVYTWVNGSDPALRAAMASVGLATSPDRESAFREWDTLRYSFRSVEKYMPWVNRVILITNGQVPSWLDTSHPKVILVTHADLWADPSALPVFNSDAIESQFPQLSRVVPDLRCFLYRNDDTFFGDFIRPDQFVTPKTALMLDGTVSNDAPIVDFWPMEAPRVRDAASNAWHHNVMYSNWLLNTLLNTHHAPARDGEMDLLSDKAKNAPHRYASHEVHFYQVRVLDRIAKVWGTELDAASRKRLRTRNTIQMPFMALNLGVIEFAGTVAQRDNFFAKITTDLEAIDRAFAFIQSKKPLCYCLNDGMASSSREKTEAASNLVNARLAQLFPWPSTFERGTNENRLFSLPENDDTVVVVPFTTRIIAVVPSQAVRAVLIALACATVWVWRRRLQDLCGHHGTRGARGGGLADPYGRAGGRGDGSDDGDDHGKRRRRLHQV